MIAIPVIGGFALETLVQTFKLVVAAVAGLFGFSVPDGIWHYVTVGVAVVATAFVALAPLIGVDLEPLGEALAAVNTLGEYLLLLIGTPAVAWIFRQLQGVTAGK